MGLKRHSAPQVSLSPAVRYNKSAEPDRHASALLSVLHDKWTPTGKRDQKGLKASRLANLLLRATSGATPLTARYATSDRKASSIRSPPLPCCQYKRTS